MNKKYEDAKFQVPGPREYYRAEISSVIREITEIFDNERVTFLELSKPRIENILSKYDVTKPEIVQVLKDNPRFSCENQKIFRKNKFDIKNYDGLLELFKKNKDGIEDNQELYQCYQSCKNDLEKLKKNGRLRIIENKNEKKIFLFLKDEKYDFPEFQDVSEILKKKWNEIIETEYAIKTQETEIKNKGKIIKNKSRKRKKRMINNVWMRHILDFREMGEES